MPAPGAPAPESPAPPRAIRPGAPDPVLERVAFGDWPNCLRLANDAIELVATTEVGPSIIRLGFVGGRNLFKAFD